MSLVRWASQLRMTLEALEDFGISTDEIEIGLSPAAFKKMLELEDFARASGVGSYRDIADVRFVARDVAPRESDGGQP